MTAGSKRPLCTVVVPVLNERGNVGPMYEALRDVANEERTIEWEFVFVDDGSTDDTFSLLAAAHAADPRLKVVQLSRNYGSHAAAAAGLNFASGDAAVIIAGDLQDHPSEIPRLIAKWRAGFDVVWAVRAKRNDPAVSRLQAYIFGAIIRAIALPSYPPSGTGSFCLIDRRVIDALARFPERNRMTFGLITQAGFRQTSIPYDRSERTRGTSKWSARRKLRHFVDTIVAFSKVPIRAVSVLGLATALLSLVYALYLAIYAVFFGVAVPGYTSVIVVVLVLGGLQLSVLGMLGEYLWRALDDIRRRPLYLVQQTVGRFPRVERQRDFVEPVAEGGRAVGGIR